ncbi:MAG TPA: purine-nucleoside phosphorylase [Candidatus Nanopelagicaceae bacterium]|nr:purine-nucleoside phosphorylase [Candidatus Nanopelagicaceae bacterium]
MSLHLAAKSGDIADRILLPGDPLRAEWIAEKFFENPVCYSTVRNMLGFTGTYQGKRISVQGTGMGAPSISIYAHELFVDYDVQIAIRVGTCGAIQDFLRPRDLILAMSASTDSSINRRALGGLDLAPNADFGLLKSADLIATERKLSQTVGGVASMDLFYDPTDALDRFREYGVLGLEMETSALYSLALKHRRRALSIVTVSDQILTGEKLSAEEREQSLSEMAELALATAVSC